MRQIDEIDPFVRHFETPTDQSLLKTVYGVGLAAFTLFNVPRHDSSLYHQLAEVLNEEPQPTQPPIEEEIRMLHESSTCVNRDAPLNLSGKELLGHLGVLMQFTSYLPPLRPFAQTPFKHIDNLHAEIVQEGKNIPLDFATQLDLALRQTAGDLPEALWRLFMTSRQYSRWYDSSVIINMPNFRFDEKMSRMYDFSHAVAACKSYEDSPMQDASGDTYYTWTHALGRLAFEALPAKQTILTKVGGQAVYNGTQLMHRLAHRFTPQHLPSDHTTAAAYGNAIGDTLVQTIQSKIK